MKTLIRIFIIIIMVGTVAAGGYWFYKNRSASAAAAGATDFIQTVAVTRGDLNASISVVGALEAVQQQDLTFERMTGTTNLQTFDAASGTKVEAGQVLATIDPVPYQQALDQAESAWQEAVQALDDLQTPPTDLEIAQADLAVAKAKLDLENAQQALADLESPDLTDLEQAASDARSDLQLAQLQQTLAEHDSLAKSERDLLYTVDWRERRIGELQALIAGGDANLEQKEELNTQQDSLAEAQADLNRVQAQRQLSTKAAAVAVADAQAALAEAQDALNTATAGGDALALAQAKLAVREAEVTLAGAQDTRSGLADGPDEVVLAAAQADVDKKKLALTEAEADLAGTTLTAPFAGTILQTNAEVGDRITANSVLLTLADMSTLQVVAAVDETNIRQVAAGQAVQITFDAFPGQTFSGQVLSVPLQGTLQGGVTVYDVPISLQGVDALPLLVGMTANLAIEVGQAQNVLLVPTMALQNVGGFYQVLVSSGDAESDPEAVPVQVGLSDGIYTEIQRGLNEGDQVVMEFSNSDTNAFGFPGGGPGGGGVFIGVGGRPGEPPRR